MIGIIPAAGRGLRFKELGKHYSKTILPYKEKPLLIHQIQFLEKHGCSDIRVVINHQEESVRETLEFYKKDVTIVKQEERNGLSGAVLCALGTQKQSDKAEDVLIILGDIVPTQDIESFEDNFVSVKEVQDYSRWCMIDAKNLEFIDKPSTRPDTNLAVSGVYYIKNSCTLQRYLEEQIQNNIKVSGEFQISTVLQQIAKTEGMKTVQMELIDFGTLEEYLQNRSVKISRSFNTIKFDGNLVTKSSKEAGEKIISEYNWFHNLPSEIAVHTPRIFNHNFFLITPSYTMEKVLAPSLRELYLFLDSDSQTWEGIFKSLFDLLDKMRKYHFKNTFLSNAVQKTKERVKKINIPVRNGLINTFIQEFEELSNQFSAPSLMHGDFCFSNLLYDFQGSKIIMIDPRGELFGDHYYEVAKLMHSILYDYDFVDAELYIMDNGEYRLYNNGKEHIKELFKQELLKRYSNDEINFLMYLCASLFLSMIPLHNHNQNNQVIYYNIFETIYRGIK